MTDKIDYAAEISEIDRVTVNGKLYLAADKIMEIMTEAEKHDQYFRYAYGEIEKLKGGEQDGNSI